MSESRKIDFSRLLGFDAVTETLAEGVDFRGETFGAKLGAKIGTEPTAPVPSSAEKGE